MSDVTFENIGGYFKYGYLGVDVFFVISGFVIFLSIQEFSAFKFIKSRISRLYPAFWVAVLATFLVSYFFGGDRYKVDFLQLVANLTMLNGYIGIKHIDGVYWTLLYEIKFYILVIFYLISAKFIKKLKNVDFFCFSWLFLSLIYLIIFHFVNPNLLILKAFNFVFILKYSHYFISGCIFYLIFKNGYKFKYILSLVLCFFIATFWAYKKVVFFETKFNTTFSFEIIYSILLFFYSFFALLVGNKLQFLNLKVFINLGLLTYPLYLLHQNIGFIIFNNFYSINKYVLIIGTITIMIIFSYYINKIVENKLKTVLSKFLDNIKIYISKNKN